MEAEPQLFSKPGDQCYRSIFTFREPDELNYVQPGFNFFNPITVRTLTIAYYDTVLKLS